jgi:hypothetical protein
MWYARHAVDNLNISSYKDFASCRNATRNGNMAFYNVDDGTSEISSEIGGIISYNSIGKSQIHYSCMLLALRGAFY